ncbi:phosphoribosylglycinamide formyltransferase-1 [Propionibacterium cyclohexanicum]|uniref:Phosphoribosylglycinamide formyltransferase n=1 Tax=Propionibacterium cyclohexanicum TaxID=64702 RepID=A0A1H9QHQ1_9ACTN|nr:phosphoribosylglycinamide formyltransferase [Propionibacterium cyclohexanicum]SER59968.1 phosphoribosylglycinamide formyltransferase-1 [Propionibacterium cyclohexanicum]
MNYRVVVLVSGAGTLLQALLDAERDGRLQASVVAVGSEMPDCAGLERARTAGVPTFCVPMPVLLARDSAARAAWDEQFARAVERYDPDLIVLAGFMKLLGQPFMSGFRGRIINSHPALLPAFPGAHAVRDALAAGAKSTGATIFWVDDGVDSGAIIAQHEVPIVADDDEATLHERIKVAERDMLVHTVNDLAANRGKVIDV